MVLATALSFGILAALAVSMKDFIGGNAAFEFSYKTVLGFVAGVSAGFFFWSFLRRRRTRNHGSEQH